MLMRLPSLFLFCVQDESIALCQQKFLGSADFLPQYGVTGLIVRMEKIVENILER